MVINLADVGHMTRIKTKRTCSKGHSFYKSTDCPTCPICEKEKKPEDGFLALLSSPARNALSNHGVDQLEKLALNPWTFTDQGIFLQSSNLEYYISNIDQVKRDLLADATKDAKQRAEEIVKSSGDVIKNIMTARAGVFQITEPYSTEVMDYGIYNTSTREKDITVTVHVTFSLE